VFLKSFKKGLFVCILGVCGFVHAQELKPFQPFEISVHKSINTQPNVIDFSLSGKNTFTSAEHGFDFLAPSENGYLVSKNHDSIFGDELVLGMKFADWLTLRLNVIDENSTIDWFGGSVLNGSSSLSDNDMFGYQFGLSSILNITNNWRVGIDLGKGRVDGNMLGLYQDQVETTRLGFGIRNQKFGATFKSDFMNATANDELDQSTMDLQVDWYFTKEGTISFGARRNSNENSNIGTSLDQLTGTVPYIKFKHTL
jgi:hypothetical protein